MANMSYCRFENTMHDLADCLSALEEVVYNHESISYGEWRCAKRMYDLCQEYICTFEDHEDDEIVIR